MTDAAAPTPGSITTVVFDFGGVVVEWNMRHLFRTTFTDAAAMEAFLADVLTPAENLRVDLGTPLAQVVEELVRAHPDHRVHLEAWRDRWLETVPWEIPGTRDLLVDLAAAGYRLVGLSNFSPETFEWTRAAYADAFAPFHDIVLSGAVGLAKPQREIYDLVCSRNDVGPGELVFFDDSPTNVAGAIDAGWRAELFTDADAARRTLARLGVTV